MPKLSVVPLFNQAWDAAQTTVGSNSVIAIEEAIDAKNAVQEFIAEFNGGKYKLRKNRDELKKNRSKSQGQFSVQQDQLPNANAEIEKLYSEREQADYRTTTAECIAENLRQIMSDLCCKK